MCGKRAGLLAFVCTLKKGYYKYQFGQFAWCHLALLVAVIVVNFTISNLQKGLIWFILPALLVVANDIFAYIFGFFFGRKFIPYGLIALSPKYVPHPPITQVVIVVCVSA